MAMSDILKSVKNLCDLNFRRPSEIFLPEIEKIKSELENKIDVIQSVPKFELEKLVGEWISGNRNFSHREIKNLPFIIHDDRISINDAAEIFRMLDFSRERHLKNFITAYLLNYDESPKTKFLKKSITMIFNSTTSNGNYLSKMLRKIYRVREFIFSDNCMDNMAKFYAKNLSINEVILAVGLSDFFKSSNFVQASLKNFFINPVTDLGRQLKILDAMNDEANIYENIFPAVADAIIQNVAHCKNFEEMNRGKKKCLEVFERNLGDPRFGLMAYRWNGVSKNSRDIFLHWLAENDLDLFFKIIEKTAVDKMWRYRKKFWKAYLPYINNTWVFLGRDAQNEAQKLGDSLIHGKIAKAAANQSVFVFQIGENIFTEWSHSGKLRVYTRKIANNFFGAENISRERIIYSDYLEEWIHSGAANYFWQKKVRDWIYDECGIFTDQNEWE